MSVDAEKVLKNLIDQEKIPSTLIFTGQKNALMLESAHHFAKEILISQGADENALSKMNQKCHIDYHEYQPASKQGLYSIEQIKEICDQSYLYPNEAVKQFFVLEHAHRMQDAAANALLKTIEEPTTSSIFILLVEDLDLLLPTIASRAFKVYFDEHQMSDESETQSTLTHLLMQWPNVTYNDIYVACEKIQKEIESDESQKEDQKDLFLDQKLFRLFNQIEKWYQEKILCNVHMPLRKVDFFNHLERAQTAVKRSMKPATCLEYLLLSLVAN